MSEIYISVDVETDGPIPGQNSMLSLGAAAFDVNGQLLATYSINLEQLVDATTDADTMKWWATQPEAWAAHREGPVPPHDAMAMFSAWVEATCKTFDESKPVFVGYPAGFDFLFVYWYLIRFTGKSPFSFSALDIKTYAMATLGCGYREVSKKNLKEFIPKDQKHTHVAVEDAVEQGHLFFNLLKKNRSR